MKARHPFWLDGGYDRDSVEACRYHPNHRWVRLRLGDVLTEENFVGYRGKEDEYITICQACYVVRCGDADGPIDPPERCALPRHHTEPHLCNGMRDPVGGLA